MNWSNLKEILRKHGFSFRKSLGQNFLIDKNILAQIVDAANVNDKCGVLEIGAGAGVLTFEMAKRAKKVVTVEIDRALLPVLKENLIECDNITVISSDILKIDINKLFAEHFADVGDIVVAANLPYYITTPIIMKLLEESERAVKSLTVMVQKEVANRMAAIAGTKDYGALSVAVQYHATPRIVTEVSQHCFMPPPNVASTVVHLNVGKRIAVENEPLFFALVKAAFGQRRKTLVNAVSNSSDIDISKDAIISALEKMGKRADVRGETFSVKDFAELSKYLSPFGGI